PAGGRRLMDEVRSGGSYSSQSDLRVHFGLGAAAEAEVEIHWPSGVVDRLRSPANRGVTVIEGESEGKGWPPPPNGIGVVLVSVCSENKLQPTSGRRLPVQKCTIEK